VTCWSGISGPSVRELPECSIIHNADDPVLQYSDVKKNHGKKNFMLSNRTAAVNSHRDVPFLDAADQEIFKPLRDFCLRVMIAVHELVGHGCGKDLSETSPSTYNFDHSSPPVNPLTGDVVKSWYKVGESAKSLFGSTYAGMNECIAELVAMHLLSNEEILKIFELPERYPAVDAETCRLPFLIGPSSLSILLILSYSSQSSM